MVATTLAEPSTAVVAEDPPTRRPGRLLDPFVVAMLTAAVGAAGASHPSLWFDESATISVSASRSIPELWRMLGHIDAVHGLYYLMMHGWFAIFPPTEFWSRVPSCLAAGIAAAGVVVFGKQFLPRTTAVCAGLVFAILPRVTWAAAEARSYAFTALAAVWLTVLLVTAIRRNRWWLWLLYALALTVSVVLNIYLILLVPAYAVVAPVLRRQKPVLLWWAITSAVAVGAVTPLLLFAHGQSFQVAWIYPLNWHNVLDVVQHQYFDNSVPFAIGAAMIFVAALTIRLTGRWEVTGDIRRMLIICAAWMVVPTAIALIYSAISDPFYYPRYLFFTTPAMAIVLAVCIVAVVTKPRWIALVLIALTAAAAPNYVLSQRQRYAKEGWDYSDVADLIATHAAPGDCLLVDNTVRWLPGPVRALLAARPAAFRPLVDVGRGVPAPKRETLWDGHVAAWLTTGRLYKCTTLWTITTHNTTQPNHQVGSSLAPGWKFGRAPAYQIPDLVGFHIVERWQFHRTQVVKSIR
ncbi:glycosyltransferase family 39 protein [Mycobacterium cookii]|nr:glycosyltransferase family 39 protein [Mycobacterium cookii]MCV7332103.1 glycosyltransferase family 39 protein [Mycobacterium cookii]